jgi:hypothetical protein
VSQQTPPITKTKLIKLPIEPEVYCEDCGARWPANDQGIEALLSHACQ